MPATTTESDVKTSEMPIWIAEKVDQTSIDNLKPYANNNRIHTASSIAKLKASVSKFGFVAPILIDRDGVINEDIAPNGVTSLDDFALILDSEVFCPI